MPRKTTPGDVEVAPRDIRFNFPSAAKGHWLGGDPVGTAVFNVLSLTFPEGERVFIDAVRHFRSQVSGKLLEDVRGFIAQESIHAREHHALNQLIDRNRYPAAEIEAEVRRRTALVREGGEMAMLSSTIALEHFTAMMAEMRALIPNMFERTAPEIERLWQWHAMEEMEHKAVAFDVFMEVTKDWSPLRRYLRRVVSMVLVTIEFTDRVTDFAARLLEADGYSRKAALKAVRRFLWSEPGIFRRGWKSYVAWYRPGFHPWDHDNRDVLASWKAEFNAASVAG